jgi:hypothetical protein
MPPAALLGTVSPMNSGRPMAIKKKTGRVHGEIQPQAFELLMARFDHLERQNDTQILLLAKQNEIQTVLINQHIEVDAKVHKVVERHSTYFSLGALGIPVIGSYIANKFLGWKPF